ncbi:hypothetical protein JL722_6380 [Aureococcus anophagefferens]|nr:hypothetical protein JL722_6380 [Aureococcus anophagefferens]
MIGAELQSLRAELVAPPAARAHRRSSFAALKADLVELKKRGGVDEDALAYVKQDIATYVRELREEAKPDAFDGDNANAMREELRILQKELADVRDAQARRPASPRSPRSPRTPRPADESALEKLSDQLSSLQATIAAPPRAIEERRRTYATITSDLEQHKRNRGEPDDRLKSRIAKYVREINEERPREGLDFDDANVAEMREELKHLAEKLKEHRRTSYANMKQDLAVLKDRAAAGRELSGDALATVKHDLAAYVEDLKSNTMTQTASDRDETREELRNLQATLAAIPKGDSTSADVMAAFAQQLASLQAAVAAPPQARQHRRTSFANLMSDVEQLKLKSATRDAPGDDAARVAAEVKAFIKEIKEEAPRRDEDYDADNANEMKQELKSVTEALSALAGNPDVAALRAEVASLRGALASPDDRKRKATYANLQKDVDELRSRRKSVARSASPKPVDERKLLDAMQAQFRAYAARALYADDLKREIKSGHDSDDVKRELANLHRGLADLKESPRFHGPEAEAPISAIFKEIEQLREEQRRVPEAQPPAEEPRKQRRMTYDKIAMDLDRLKLDVAATAGAGKGCEIPKGSSLGRFPLATAERERHLEEREDRLEDRLLNSGRGRDDDAVSTAVVALESRLGAYFGALKSDLEQSSRQASARDEATSELESLKRQAPASVSRAPECERAAAQVQELQVARRVEELTPRPEEGAALRAMEARIVAMADELRHAQEDARHAQEDAREAKAGASRDNEFGLLRGDVRALSQTVESLSPRGGGRALFGDARHEDPDFERLRRDVDRLSGEDRLSADKLKEAVSSSVAKGLEAATPRRDDQASELQRALLAQSTALNALTEEIRRDRGRDAPAGTGELEQLRLRFEAVERQQRETPSAAADDRLKAELLSAIKSETQARELKARMLEREGSAVAQLQQQILQLKDDVARSQNQGERDAGRKDLESMHRQLEDLKRAPPSTDEPYRLLERQFVEHARAMRAAASDSARRRGRVVREPSSAGGAFVAEGHARDDEEARRCRGTTTTPPPSRGRSGSSSTTAPSAATSSLRDTAAEAGSRSPRSHGESVAAASLERQLEKISDDMAELKSSKRDGDPLAQLRASASDASRRSSRARDRRRRSAGEPSSTNTTQARTSTASRARSARSATPTAARRGRFEAIAVDAAEQAQRDGEARVLSALDGQLKVVTDQIAELGGRERTAHKDLEDRVSGHVETLKREVDLVRDAPKENVALRRAAASASIFWRHLVFSGLPARLRSSEVTKLSEDVAALKAHAQHARSADGVEDRLRSLAETVQNLPTSLSRDATSDAVKQLSETVLGELRRRDAAPAAARPDVDEKLALR